MSICTNIIELKKHSAQPSTPLCASPLLNAVGNGRMVNIQTFRENNFSNKFETIKMSAALKSAAASSFKSFGVMWIGAAFKRACLWAEFIDKNGSFGFAKGVSWCCGRNQMCHFSDSLVSFGFAKGAGWCCGQNQKNFKRTERSGFKNPYDKKVRLQ